jgi:hypothetical protein
MTVQIYIISNLDFKYKVQILCSSDALFGHMKNKIKFLKKGICDHQKWPLIEINSNNKSSKKGCPFNANK